MVKTDSNNDVTAYISLVFIGLVLFILTVGCLCRMCRPVKKKLIVKVKQQPRIRYLSSDIGVCHSRRQKK